VKWWEDRTGVEGLYAFALRWSPDEQNSGGADAAPSLFTQFRRRLAFDCRLKKVPVNIVVIDHIERSPMRIETWGCLQERDYRRVSPGPVRTPYARKFGDFLAD